MPSHVRISILAASGAMAAISASAYAGQPDVQTSSSLVYNALGGAENGGDSFSSGGPVLVDQILTGSTATSLKLVTLNLALSKLDLGSFEVVVENVTGKGIPATPQVVATVQDMSLSTAFTLVTVKPAAPVMLMPNTRYYVGIHRVSGGMSHVILGNTLDPVVLARGSVKTGGLYFNNGGVQSNAGGPYEIRIVAQP